jgi:hypothetical protein
MKMQRILLIIAGIIVLLGILAGAYFLFFASRGPALIVDPPQDPFGGTGSGDAEPGGPDEELPEPGRAGVEVAPRLVKITDGPVARGAVAFPVELPLAPVGDATTSPGTVPDTEVRYVSIPTSRPRASSRDSRTAPFREWRKRPGSPTALSRISAS